MPIQRPKVQLTFSISAWWQKNAPVSPCPHSFRAFHKVFWEETEFGYGSGTLNLKETAGLDPILGNDREKSGIQ